ncbi:MAG TPA: winged helix-turn-helix domain-containing protein [Polyangiaceae bacterium]|nr:winged helix-turn-helix domain-containing protein [Polyangiaceae bacterium]
MHRLYFGEFWAEVDEAGCHGVFREHEPVALSDVPRKVLFLLLQQHPRPIVAKDLLGELWHPGANPSNIAKQVRALRFALGDDGTQRYIRTLNKQGYAFVMPVADAPPSPGSGTALARSSARFEPGEPASRAGAPGIAIEWSLAREKLLKDFQGSCLHDVELLSEALEECEARIQLLTERRRIRAESRAPREPLFVPPREAWTSSSTPSSEVAARASELIEYSKAAPLMINVGSYNAACIAVLQSLRRRFGLEARTDFQALSGRQQVLQLHNEDGTDFLFAPHVPVLLVGDRGTVDYRRITPVHSYEQVLLRKSGATKGRKRKLLVYKGGYPEEQLLAHAPLLISTEPEMVGSLQKLLEKVQDLAPGDMVIAWQPLASGLESKNTFTRHGEYRCWVSLYCHKRWLRGALRTLKEQFLRLFASEWSYCRWNEDWALECLRIEQTALESFTAGSGLGPTPGSSRR